MLGVRVGVIKNPTAHVVLRLRPATIVCRKEKPEGTTPCIKNHPVWKKA